jgi:hypothetical protein
VPAAPALLEQLRRAGSDLPPDLAEQIMAVGQGATPLLLTLLLDADSTDDENAQACSECGMPHEHQWARLHAVDLLTELRDPGAIEPLLGVLEGASPDDAIYDKIVERLPRFGSAATEPILAALARTKDPMAGEALCCILSALGARDDRILRALVDLLAARPRAGALYLSEYGDAAACPALFHLIVTSIAEGENTPTRAALPDLVDAYTALGGELPADIRAKID